MLLTEYIVSLLVAAQFFVVLLIVILLWKLASSVKTAEFEILKLSWLFGLLYISIMLITLIGKTVEGGKLFESITNSKVSNDSIFFFDILQFAFLYYALVKSTITFPNKKLILLVGKWWWVIGAITFALSLFWDIFSFNFLPGINAHLIPGVLYNSFALFLSAYLLKNISQAYRVTSNAAFLGSIFYALVQVIAIWEISSDNDAFSILGWSVGLIAKSFICWGLLLIFKAQANKSRRLEIILSNLFHELKNLLYGIDGPVQKILHEKHISPRGQAKEIEKTYETMASIIESTDLLYKRDLSEILVEEDVEFNFRSIIDLKKEEVRLNSLVQAAIKISKNFTKGRVKIKCDYGGGCDIICLKHEIIQVIVNLIKNAFESFINKHGQITITTRNKYVVFENGEKREIKCVNIEIVDNGPGIPSEIQMKVFEEGFTTKSKGSGIGLSLAKRVIDASYGRLVLESPVKGYPEIAIGSKFTIFFDKN